MLFCVFFFTLVIFKPFKTNYLLVSCFCCCCFLCFLFTFSFLGNVVFKLSLFIGVLLLIFFISVQLFNQRVKCMYACVYISSFSKACFLPSSFFQNNKPKKINKYRNAASASSNLTGTCTSSFSPAPGVPVRPGWPRRIRS